MIKKYRKKPVVVEALQYTGNNVEEIKQFCPNCTNLFDNLIIPTLEGRMRVSVGDYIIKGIIGEYYPCKEKVFNDTYETIDTDDAKYSVWVDGTEVNDHCLTKEEAEELAEQYKVDYDDVFIEYYVPVNNMSRKAEEAAMKAYPQKGDNVIIQEGYGLMGSIYVDGYEAGYEQAEKDLALTWEDVKRIEDLCMQVTTLFAMVGRNKNILEQLFYEEVAKRFNEQMLIHIKKN